MPLSEKVSLLENSCRIRFVKKSLTMSGFTFGTWDEWILHAYYRVLLINVFFILLLYGLVLKVLKWCVQGYFYTFFGFFFAFTKLNVYPSWKLSNWKLFFIGCFKLGKMFLKIYRNSFCHLSSWPSRWWW